MSYDFDLLVIGAGSGGVAASRRAAAHGARVALCEADRIGGTCVLRGCVPKKLLVYGASFAEEFANAAGFGWELPAPGARFDWARLQAEKDRELERLSGIYRRLLQESGVTTFAGRARLRNAHTVTVAETELSARHILIATGSWPTRPEIPGRELAISSNEALSLPALPRRLLVVGGGYIAVELSSVFAALGVDVTMLIRNELPLRGFDHDLRTHLHALLISKGIRIIGPVQALGIERTDDGSLMLKTDQQGPFFADEVLMATGRAPSTEGLGLDEVGVFRNRRGAVKIDEQFCTSVPSIYAIGDCTDRLNLTPVAVAEGRTLAESLFGKHPFRIDYTRVPTAVFGIPPLASVGLSEAAAHKLHGRLDIYVATFRPLKYTLAGRDERTLVKLIVAAESQRVLGCHMLGPDAPEIIQSLAVALSAGATKADFDRTMALHPTSAEEFVLLRERRVQEKS